MSKFWQPNTPTLIASLASVVVVQPARNLVHYVSLRQQDLRALQQELLGLGLSSLGRCEANVLATLNAVIAILYRLIDSIQSDLEPAEVSFRSSRELLYESTAALFGERPSVGGGTHIMVTMPSEASRDGGLVFDLLAQGMDCMRVNCAHDEQADWQQMIANLRQACDEQNRTCKVIMDLAGPKLRTGPIQSGIPVIKWRPYRDDLGRVIFPARIWLYDRAKRCGPPVPGDAALPVDGRWLKRLQNGDIIRLRDARGRRRRLKVSQRRADGAWAEAAKTAYVVPGLKLFHEVTLPSGKRKSRPVRVAPFPAREQNLSLRPGDRLLLGDDCLEGSPAQLDLHGQVFRAATIGCTLPSVFRDLKRGDRVLFDDGKIAARVEEIHDRHVVLEVTSGDSKGVKLQADKGINLPDTDLHLDSLTGKDLSDLSFIVQHADMVGYSFVRRVEDVERLQKELARLGRPDMPIVLKVENRQAFEHLPSLLLTAMRSPVIGVIIARGDLAVELGWQRLAEVQEEILWMCEAAHVPVVWATQVLESLAKTGTPSRAEITDAAMGVRAECVMLNKGDHILDAVRVLVDILQRMQDHQVKKRPLLRRLRLADDLTPMSSGFPPEP